VPEMPDTRSGQAIRRRRRDCFFCDWNVLQLGLVCSLEPSAFLPVEAPMKWAAIMSGSASVALLALGFDMSGPLDNIFVLAGAASAVVFFGLVALV
jgi:hypothetical protein